MKKKLICFDLDGTLIDSTDANVQAYKIAFEKNNIRFPGKQKLVRMFGMEHEKLVRMVAPKASARKVKQIVQDHINAQAKTCHLIKPIPNVKDALAKLKKHFKLGIVSNNFREAVMELLECAKIPPNLFDVVVGEDHVKPKPSAAEILLAEKLTKADAKFMVGDTVYDILAGKRAHCKTIAVLTGVHNFERLMKANPDILVSSAAVLPDILLND